MSRYPRSELPWFSYVEERWSVWGSPTNHCKGTIDPHWDECAIWGVAGTFHMPSLRLMLECVAVFTAVVVLLPIVLSFLYRWWMSRMQARMGPLFRQVSAEDFRMLYWRLPTARWALIKDADALKDALDRCDLQERAPCCMSHDDADELHTWLKTSGPQLRPILTGPQRIQEVWDSLVRQRARKDIH